MSINIIIATAKGGVGKTTTAMNLGSALARNGYQVCLIDNDPQGGQLTKSLGLNPPQLKYTLANLLFAAMDDTNVEDYLEHCILPVFDYEEGLFCIPSNKKLAGTAARLISMKNSEAVLGDMGDAIKSEYVMQSITKRLEGQFDYIIIDCGPSLDMLTINALVAANQVIIPVQAHYLAEEGLITFLDTVQNIKKNLNPDLIIGGILLTMYQSQTNLCRYVREDIEEKYGNMFHVFNTPITYSIKVAEHPALKKSIFAHDPKNPAAAAYMDMAKEVLSYYGKERACS
jgi:chromosome partitioning protein